MGNRGNVVALIGGLGNQLFQLGFGQRLEAESGITTSFDAGRGHVHPGLLAIAPQVHIIDTCHSVPGLGPTGRLCRIGNFWRRIALGLPVHTHMDMAGPDAISDSTPAYWCGYWQRPDHIDAVPTLVKTLQHNLQAYGSSLSDIRATHPGQTVVAIHVRRGDYVGNTPTLSASYFARAHARLMEQLALSAAEVVTVVATDDPRWVRQHLALPTDLVVADATSAISDLATLALSDARVISNSTFSWWAARLARNAGSRTTAAPSPWTLSRALDDVGGSLRLPGWHSVPAEYETHS